MKKILLIGIIAFALSLASCDNKPAKQPEQPKPATIETPAPQTDSGEIITQLNFDKPTVVDFYATWCGPCKTIAPIIQRLETKYAGKVNFIRVDVDQNNQLAAQWEVEAIPTLLFATKGEVINRSVGALSESEIEALIKTIL